MTKARKLLIFDADATLRRCTVPDQPCPNRNGEWEILPWVREALAGVHWGETRFGIASNQAGVAKGYLSYFDAFRMLLECAQEVLPAHAFQDVEHAAIRYCPHDPTDGCECRKPRPAMLERIMDQYGIGPNETTFVGDLDTDKLAAEAAGCLYQWVWDFCGKTQNDWLAMLSGRALAKVEPAWIDVPNGCGDKLVMRFDRGACPACGKGLLRPRISGDYSAYHADQCDRCNCSWWHNWPLSVPARFRPPGTLPGLVPSAAVDTREKF